MTGRAFHQDLVTVLDQFPYTTRRQTHPVFVVLDFPWHTDAHD
jgi:hypothetical protein